MTPDAVEIRRARLGDLHLMAPLFDAHRPHTNLPTQALSESLGCCRDETYRAYQLQP